MSAAVPTVHANPKDASCYVSKSVFFSAGGTGGGLLDYRWEMQDAGSSIWTNVPTDDPLFHGELSQVLNLYHVPIERDGTRFRCRIWNAEGAVYTEVATLTVLAQPPVDAVVIEANATELKYHQFLHIFATTQSSSETGPLTYQWYRDGEPIAGATRNYYNDSDTKETESGEYSVRVTNPGGTVESNKIAITIAPIATAEFSYHPQPLAVELGMGFELKVHFSVATLQSVQWLRDGEPIAGAHDAGKYSVLAATAADTGVYQVEVTNPAGTIRSESARVEVVSPALPRITSKLYAHGAWDIGPEENRLDLRADVSGAKPMGFQWFKDGQVFSGANAQRLEIYRATAAMAGAYRLEASNDMGVASSVGFEVDWEDLEQPWLQTAREGDVQYFLMAEPGRLLRYDLVQETWLSPIPLDEQRGAPTAFLPTPEGVFVAYNTALVRHAWDFQQQELLIEVPGPIPYLMERGEWVYYAYWSNYGSYHKSTLVAGAAGIIQEDLARGGGLTYTQPIYSETAGAGYSARPRTHPGDVLRFTFDDDGGFETVFDSPYHGHLPLGTSRFVSPDGTLVYESGGSVYDADDLTYHSSLGMGYSDLVFMPAGDVVVLRNDALAWYSQSAHARIAGAELAQRAYAITNQGDTVFAFGALESSSQHPVVMKVSPGGWAAVERPRVKDARSKRFSVEEAFVDDEGVIHVVSRMLDGMVRWDAKTRDFLSPVPLAGVPVGADFSTAQQRLVLLYDDGAVAAYRPGEATDTLFATLPNSMSGAAVVAMGENTLIDSHRGVSTSSNLWVIAPDGRTVLFHHHTRFTDTVSWAPHTGRLFGEVDIAGPPGEDFAYVTVTAEGVLPKEPEKVVSNIGLSGPLHISPDSEELLAPDGRLYDHDLERLGELVEAGHPVDDALWLPSGLYTIRDQLDGTELQVWSREDYGLRGTRRLAGKPVAMFSSGETELVVLTLVEGWLAFQVVPHDLSRVEVFYANPSASTAPVVALGPLAQTASAGDPVTYEVKMLGQHPLSYHWQVRAAGEESWSDLQDGSNYRGAATSALTVTAKAELHGLSYRCHVTNARGTAVSSPAGLAVKPAAPSILAQPEANTIDASGVAVFNVEVQEGGLVTYQWQSRAPGAAEWGDLVESALVTGVGSPTLSIAGSGAVSGTSYRCRITNATGQAISEEAKLTVSSTAAAPQITLPPTSVLGALDGTVSFSVTASGGGGLKYQWQRSNPGSSHWEDLPDATTAQLSVPSSPADSGTRYRVVVWNSAGEQTSAPATLTVAAPPVLSLETLRRLVRSPGQGLSIEVSAAGAGPFDYRWARKGRTISGANSARLVLEDLGYADAGYYTVDVTNAFGTTRSDAVFVVIAPPATEVVGWGSGHPAKDLSPLANAVEIFSGNGYELGLDREGRILARPGLPGEGEDLTGVVELAIASHCVIALQSDGTLVALGDCYWGQGNIPAGLDGVVAVSMNYYHVLALKSDGTVVSWGAENIVDNEFVRVPDGLEDVIEIVATHNGGVALRSDGSVRGWGDAQYTRMDGVETLKGGRSFLGLTADGTIVSPQQTWNLVYGVQDVVAMTATESFRMVLTNSGELVGWGREIFGELSVPPDLADVVGLASGTNNVLAMVDLKHPVLVSPNTDPVVESGEHVAFTVNALGEGPFTYQWRRNGVPLQDDNVFGGTTTSTLQILGATGAQIDAYDVVVTNASGSTQSRPFTFSLYAAPQIEQAPRSASVNLGGTMQLKVVASADPHPTYQWYHEGRALEGEVSPTYTLRNAQATHAGAYTVAVSNRLGTAISAPAALTVNTGPKIITPPASIGALPGDTVTLRVEATGVAPLGYQWRKDGVNIPGATGATLTLSNVTTADLGDYTVVVTDEVDSVTSSAATLSLVTLLAEHTLPGPGYRPGLPVRINVRIRYTGTPDSLSLSVLAPADAEPGSWTFTSAPDVGATTAPAANDTALWEWTWNASAEGGLDLFYVITAPEAATGSYSLAATVSRVDAGQATPALLQPDPLALEQATRFHAADTNGDFHLSLGELLRVIELYNTRKGTSRTGRYRISTAGSVDGFATDPNKSTEPPAGIARFHSADTNRDARLSLSELLRVIELYNTRKGTQRTGGYRASPETADGFQSGADDKG